MDAETASEFRMKWLSRALVVTSIIVLIIWILLLRGRWSEVCVSSAVLHEWSA
jgi:hypothetical protein